MISTQTISHFVMRKILLKQTQRPIKKIITVLTINSGNIAQEYMIWISKDHKIKLVVDLRKRKSDLSGEINRKLDTLIIKTYPSCEALSAIC